MARFLVTGGAGYVGSHVVLALVERGDEVVVMDNLWQGHRAAVPAGVPLVVADVGDRRACDEIFAGWRFDGVLHMAALTIIDESMREPTRYIGENVATTMLLAEMAARAGCPRFVFSSTAAVYGLPDGETLHEESPLGPASPYGEGKLMGERGLDWVGSCLGLASASLRYFNAAGADPLGRLGEDHTPETHLVPNAIRAALGQGPGLTVYGTDYPTPDGTCVRDYVHVSDVADAHLRVMDRLKDPGCQRYNVGSGRGYSVLEVIRSVERVTGHRLPHGFGPRRPGDPPILVASNEKLRRETGWEPRLGALDDMVRTAHAWRLANPDGFPKG